jgi:dihydropteroate synthase
MSVFPRKVYALDLKSRELQVGARTLIMGILNVTPDSFTDGGKFLELESAVKQAKHLIHAGADILDIGGESTRPFSEAVSVGQELSRVIPVIEAVRRFSNIPISIDTTKAVVARQALEAGADILNDVSALRFDDQMTTLAATTGVPLVLMHMQGTPRNMQQNPTYSSLFSQVIAFLQERIDFATQNGIARNQILVDPGIGFGKAIIHNLQLVKDLHYLHCLDRPVILGASRKRFIGNVLDLLEGDREIGTAVVNSFGIAAGAHILRVHDVSINKQVVLMGDALRGAQ